MKQKKVNFKFDGDMQPDVALNEEYKELYPFSEIVGNANVLIMPGQHSAAISYKIMKTLGGAKVIGPLLNWSWRSNRNCSFKIINFRYFKSCFSCCLLSERN